MAQVRIEVGGRSYPVACRDGEEARLLMLGRLIETRAADAVRATGAGDEARGLLMAALLLADELDEARSVVAELHAQEVDRVAALARCAERIDALAAKLENGGQSA